MTTLAEMSHEEVMAHAVAIAAAQTEETFVAAFSAYVQDVVSRETRPFEKVALFVHGMIEGLRKCCVTSPRDDGQALKIVATRTKEAFVAAFAAYVQDVVSRETAPYVEIALFVHCMVEGRLRRDGSS